MKFAAGNAQHIGARPEQQDAFGFSDPKRNDFTQHAGFLGVVADGMGGIAGGREASLTAVHSFLAAYDAKGPAETITDALLRSINEANQAVVSLGRSKAEQNTGTTLAAAVLHEGGLYWISAGDTRVYLLRDQKLTRLTADHTYGRQLDESVLEGEVSLTVAKSHPDRGSLTSYLGKNELPQLDRSARPFPLDPGDCVIVCSDGFYRALSEREISAAFQGDLNRACDQLLLRALQKGRAYQDNLTVIALSNDPHSVRNLDCGRKRFTRNLTLSLVAAGVLLVGLLCLPIVWRKTRTVGIQAPEISAPASSSQPKYPAMALPNFRSRSNPSDEEVVTSRKKRTEVDESSAQKADREAKDVGDKKTNTPPPQKDDSTPAPASSNQSKEGRPLPEELRDGGPKQQKLASPPPKEAEVSGAQQRNSGSTNDKDAVSKQPGSVVSPGSTSSTAKSPPSSVSPHGESAKGEDKPPVEGGSSQQAGRPDQKKPSWFKRALAWAHLKGEPSESNADGAKPKESQ